VIVQGGFVPFSGDILSEALFHGLDHAPIGVLLIARGASSIRYANSSLESMLGYEHGTLAGRELSLLLPESTHAAHPQWVAHFFDHPQVRPMGAGKLLHARHRGGYLVPVEIGLAPQRVDGVDCVVAYVTNRSEVIRVQSHLELLLRTLPLGVVVADELGHIVETNPTLDAQFGYATGELIGKPLHDLLPERSRKAHVEYFGSYRMHPQKRLMGEGRDLTARHRTGVEFPVEVALNHLASEEGSRYVAVVSDISERKQIEDALRQTNAQLEEFTYVASHDLRSPLRGIADLLGWIEEEIPRELISEDVAHNFDRVRLRIERCERMIDDLLVYARAGKQEGATERIDPKAVIGEALEMQTIPSGFQVELDVKSDLFEGYRTPLALSLRNLISNAFKHHGQAAGRVRISGEDVGRFILFKVEDDGQGVPDSARERVFKLFQRANTLVDGHGVGLAVTRRMITAHGGAIVVERSKALGGACFRFYWPRVLMKEFDHD